MPPTARPPAGERDRKQPERVLDEAQRHEGVEVAQRVRSVVSGEARGCNLLDARRREFGYRRNELGRQDVFDAARLETIDVELGSTSSRSAEAGITPLPSAAAVMKGASKVRGELPFLRFHVGLDVLVADLAGQILAVPPCAQRKEIVPVAVGRLAVTLVTDRRRQQPVKAGVRAVQRIGSRAKLLDEPCRPDRGFTNSLEERAIPAYAERYRRQFRRIRPARRIRCRFRIPG